MLCYKNKDVRLHRENIVINKMTKVTIHVQNGRMTHMTFPCHGHLESYNAIFHSQACGECPHNLRTLVNLVHTFISSNY